MSKPKYNYNDFDPSKLKVDVNFKVDTEKLGAETKLLQDATSKSLRDLREWCSMKQEATILVTLSHCSIDFIRSLRDFCAKFLELRRNGE